MDPRAAYYVPKSLKKLVCHGTFSKMEFRAKRQIDQAKERRGGMSACEVDYIDRVEGEALLSKVPADR